MFQYAAARAVALRCAAPLRLDLREICRDRRRHAAVLQFQIDATAASPIELQAYPETLLRWTRRLPVLARWGRCYLEPSLGFDPAVRRLQAPHHLSGYFQSEDYFRDARESLLQQFRPRAPLSGRAAEWAAAAAACRSVSVHVRRGDYVADAKVNAVHGVCDVGHFRRAVQALLERADVDRYFVFSDDLAWARKNLRLPRPAVFVDGHAQAPEIDLFIMTHCLHHIGSNSSFSWWAAWLGRQPGGVAIAPARWFAASRLASTHPAPAAWVRV
jgi:hypothetical protein